MRSRKNFRPCFTATLRLLSLWFAIGFAGLLDPLNCNSGERISTTPPVTAIVSPEEWARLCVQGCRSEQSHRREDLARLKENLAQTALSSEEKSFPVEETRAYEKQVEKERHVRLNQLNYFLFKSKKQVFKETLRHHLPWSSDFRTLDGKSFGHAIDTLTVGASPCVLDALESTLLIAAFDLPLNSQWIVMGISPSQVFEEVEKEYARRVRADYTLEEIYIALRPKGQTRPHKLIEALFSNMVAGSGNSVSFSRNFERPLSQEVEQFFHIAIEPLRLRLYLNMVIASLETSIGIRISQKSLDKLQEEIQKRFFDNVQMMSRLANAPPSENIKQICPLIDEWFQKEALPELEMRLFPDPFSAFWFYVQTGMVVHSPFAFRGARLTIDPQTSDLKLLNGHTTEEALRILRQNKVPSSYIERFWDLEKSMSETVMPRSELLNKVDDAGVNSSDQVRLRQILPPAETISTLDLLSFFVRDASRVQGAPDISALMTALKVLQQAKRERMNFEIQNLPPSGDQNQLATYLHTAGEWMLELEEREAREAQFEESIGGGPVGWLLRHTVMASGVPVKLWAPGGVTGEAFSRLVDNVVASNPQSGRSYRGKFGPDARFVESGDYHEELVEIINTARNFLNIQQFDWKLDRGGKEITYRLMAKKLGLSPGDYESLVGEFKDGLALNDTIKNKTLFFDIPTSGMKNLLFYKLFLSSQQPPINIMRHKLEGLLGGKLDCPSVESCGDLSKIYQIAGERFDKRRGSEPGYQEVWEFYQQLQSLFEEHEPSLQNTRPRRWLADYLKERTKVQCFVRNYGLRRADDPNQPFEINIVADGKQDVGNLLWFHPSNELPYIYSRPVRELHKQLFEFNVRLVLWKGVVEFPWHIGPLPIGGRWIGGVFPFPYIPWPWLEYVPGFGWTGIVFQHFVATDVRSWWATASHAKSVSSETKALESGMGFATKYFNLYPGFQTWHDTGVVADGPVVGDVNDRFVREFNRARINNRGIPGSYGVKIPPLRYENYQDQGEESSSYRSWVLTTNTVGKDYDYRGVFMAALAAAHDNIYIENVFFSDQLITRMLVRKAREFRARVNCNGLTDLECEMKKQDAVRIYLILPQATDKPSVDRVGRSDFYEMIREGVKVYQWNPRNGYAAQKMLHTKAWLIDYQEGKPALAYVGSHNAEQRSLWADNEMGILTTSPKFAKDLYRELFLPDLKRDSTLANRSSFEIERLMHPGQIFTELVRLFMVDLSWVY